MSDAPESGDRKRICSLLMARSPHAQTLSLSLSLSLCSKHDVVRDVSALLTTAMQGSSLQTFTPVPDPKETSSILQTGSVYHAQQGTWVETEPMEINWRLGLSLQAQEIFSMYCSTEGKEDDASVSLKL
ncbi:unnamed protein product [Sphagnum jensenii]|uniref:Uncharacterized protein n=1 Tax=Sphagnum jensenii TaxID=128206 RepID=A0ABP1BR84_9BRYO